MEDNEEIYDGYIEGKRNGDCLNLNLPILYKLYDKSNSPETGIFHLKSAPIIVRVWILICLTTK